MGIKEVNEDPRKDVEPLKGEVLGLLEKQLYLVPCVDGCLGLTALLSSNSQPPTATIQLSAGSGDRDSRQEGEESEEREGKMKRRAEGGRGSEKDTDGRNKRERKANMRNSQRQGNKEKEGVRERENQGNESVRNERLKSLAGIRDA